MELKEGGTYWVWDELVESMRSTASKVMGEELMGDEAWDFQPDESTSEIRVERSDRGHLCLITKANCSKKEAMAKFREHPAWKKLFEDD